jgi:tetratricopeptide (TPR) repeat protein
MSAWEEAERDRDPRAGPDALIEAALGILYLVRGEPARAYPRLREACQAFPDVGFLTTYLADAAVQCGDVQAAAALLGAAASMPRPDPEGAWTRVSADLLAATGRDVQAEELYHRASIVSPAGRGYARFLESRGRREEAIAQHVLLARHFPGRLVQLEYAAALERWWADLPTSEARMRLGRTLDQPWGDPRSLVTRLRLYRGARPAAVSQPDADGGRGLFSTLAFWLASPPLQSLSLADLGEILEVDDMKRWTAVPRYPTLFKRLQLWAWRSPWPGAISGLLQRGHEALGGGRRASMNPALLLTAAGLLAAPAARAQSPCLGWDRMATMGPVARGDGHDMAYDAARGVTVLFGGIDDNGNYLGDTWTWDGVAWTRHLVSGPSPRRVHAMAYDSGRGVVVLHGGYDGTNPRLSDTWEWDGAAWTLRGFGPSNSSHAMVYDGARGQVVMFGGAAAGFLGDTWTWNGSVWTHVASSGPAPRATMDMAYDPVRQVTVLFGGFTPGLPYWSDTWEWDGTSWALRATTGPGPRANGEMVFDIGRNRTLLFGGDDPLQQTNDTWEWDGTTWVRIVTTSSPERRSGHRMAYDLARHRTVLFGGGVPDFHAYGGDTWELDISGTRANAGDDQSVPEGTLVTLDGFASSVRCGTGSYAWTQLAGPAVTLNLSDPARPTFTAPAVPSGGTTLTFQLVVDDGVRQSAGDVVNVTVTNVNHPPVATAGDDQTVAELSPVTLDGSNSYDPDNEPLTFTWTQTAGPAVTLDLDDPRKPEFVAPIVGPAGATLAFELRVGDGLDVAIDSVSVIVENVNHPPVADAGPDQTVAEGAAVALGAGASGDPDGDPLTFAWTQTGGPAVTLTGAGAAAAAFTAPAVGPGGAVLVFQVTVDDGWGGSAFDEVRISVQDASAPPACAGVRPGVSELWPPNHKMLPVRILGLGTAAITILGVTQDEPVSGLGDGDTGPDAVIQGGTVLVRAERSGTGNGRVYRIAFQATDGSASCTGLVRVVVPHGLGRNAPPPVDDGLVFSSLVP